MVNVLIIIAGFGLGNYISFARGEGTDERGKFILANASHITMSFLFLTFAILVLVIEFLNIPAEILGTISVIALFLLILIHAISIMYLRKHV